MRIIVQVKEGIVSNVVCILFLLSLCAFLIWYGVKHDRVVLYISPVFCVAWLFGGYICLRNICRPKSCTLGIDGDRLVCSLRTRESGESQEIDIPLSSIAALEFVLPVMGLGDKGRGRSLAELFIVGVDGKRVQLPMELLPGVFRDQITAAMKQTVPGIQVIERSAEK